MFQGDAPFANSPPTTVAVRVLSGKRPERPAHSSLTDELWDLTECCWDQEPQRRPKISEVVRRLRTDLAAQEGYADGANVVTTDDTVSGDSKQTGAPHRGSSFLTLQSFISGLEGLQRMPLHTAIVRWFRRPRTSLRKYHAASDKPSGIQFNGSGDSLHDAKFGEWEKPLDSQSAPSISHGFLRRMALRLSNRRAHSARNYDGR